MPPTPASPGPRDWADRIPDEEWRIYREAIAEAQRRDLPFALGGGIAFSYYADRWRNTKDLDFFVLPRDRDAFIDVLHSASFEDLHDSQAYDREWIYRGVRGDVIIDVIWQMANYRAQVDEQWLTRGPELRMHDRTVRVIPAEELVWAKLFVLQRERCDWPDLLNVVHRQGAALDWERLLSRLGEDARLLGGLLSVYAWLCPEGAAALPEWLWRRLGVLRPEGDAACRDQHGRVRLLDSRPWFGPLPDGDGAAASD